MEKKLVVVNKVLDKIKNYILVRKGIKLFLVLNYSYIKLVLTEFGHSVVIIKISKSTN